MIAPSKSNLWIPLAKTEHSWMPCAFISNSNKFYLCQSKWKNRNSHFFGSAQIETTDYINEKKINRYIHKYCTQNEYLIRLNYVNIELRFVTNILPNARLLNFCGSKFQSRANRLCICPGTHYNKLLDKEFSFWWGGQEPVCRIRTIHTWFITHIFNVCILGHGQKHIIIVQCTHILSSFRTPRLFHNYNIIVVFGKIRNSIAGPWVKAINLLNNTRT